jgi:hypothetical protein
MSDHEALEDWEKVADYLRGIFKGEHELFGYAEDEPDGPPRIGEVGMYLVRGKNGVKLALRPDHLQGALELYAARMATSGTTFNTCEHCNSPFLSGGSGRTKKRGDARFCSSECRWRHHNEMRRKAKCKS